MGLERRLTKDDFLPSSGVWIQWWTSETITRGNDRLAFYLALYASMGLVAVLAFVSASSYFMLKIVPRSARKFHSTLLETVFR